MSLYFEAAKILEGINNAKVSLKDQVFKDKALKSSPAALFALVSEASKWSEVLSEVIGKSQLLSLERKLTPALSLVLVHDLLLAKHGLALSKKHALYETITKHRARLSSELTRSRIKRSLPSVDALRIHVNASATSLDPETGFHPRWVRINTILTTPQALLSTHFASYKPVLSLSALSSTPYGIYTDPNIPNLVALHPSQDLTKTKAYLSGQIILQDKASCFPAYLLNPSSSDGRVIDGCAAPGNKTTHLAAILHENGSKEVKQVTACERSIQRAQTLETMVRKAGAAGSVEVRKGQDFLALKPDEYADVGAILLDPSCSGSGIVGRDGGGRKVTFPIDPKAAKSVPDQSEGGGKGKKRKRGADGGKTDGNLDGNEMIGAASDETEKVMEDEEVDAQYTREVEGDKLKERLRALSAFQLKLLLHAFRFPGATRITYSTCSVHVEENEGVVIKALLSEVAGERGWRVMRKEEQVDGLKRWETRGDAESTQALLEVMKSFERMPDADEVAEACIRCAKGTDDGVMGFFVCGFVRDTGRHDHTAGGIDQAGASSDESEFEGFD
ncbi:16S rRNA methyltransferase RsmB/F-like protein 3 [Elsinoe fawcettii]|nr:16S rRNA methyltransferase RsmB/F-like protein 3 [Elsinoe fawcettii]